MPEPTRFVLASVDCHLTAGAHGLGLDLFTTRWPDIHRFPRGGRAVINSGTHTGVDPAICELDCFVPALGGIDKVAVRLQQSEISLKVLSASGVSSNIRSDGIEEVRWTVNSLVSRDHVHLK